MTLLAGILEDDLPTSILCKCKINYDFFRIRARILETFSLVRLARPLRSDSYYHFATQRNNPLVALVAFWRTSSFLFSYVRFRPKADSAFRVVDAGVKKYLIEGRM